MKSIVWYDTERVMQFVADRTGEERYDNCAAIGLEEDGQLIAGVVFQNHCGPNVLMHVASDGSRRWMTPAYLCACFRYPFESLKVRRITGLVRVDNVAAQKFDEHLGFVREGLMRQAASDGTDMIVYGLLKKDCKYLDGRYLESLHREVYEHRETA
jgi:RimJ/RimL family protein N-acetyltransferase